MLRNLPPVGQGAITILAPSHIFRLAVFLSCHATRQISNMFVSIMLDKVAVPLWHERNFNPRLGVHHLARAHTL